MSVLADMLASLRNPRPVVRRLLAAGRRVPYTDALGLPALRQRIAAHYQWAYGVALDPVPWMR